MLKFSKFKQAAQVAAIAALAERFSECFELGGVDEPHPVGDLLRARNFQALPLLDRLNEARRG